MPSREIMDLIGKVLSIEGFIFINLFSLLWICGFFDEPKCNCKLCNSKNT